MRSERAAGVVFCGLALLACAGAGRAAKAPAAAPTPASATRVSAPKGSAAESVPLTPGDRTAELAATEKPEAEQEETGAPSGWLGVELAMRPVDEPGVMVRSVVPGSPAERAGLMAGDVVLSIAGESVSRPSELVASVGSHAAGERVAIALLRNTQERLLAATLEPLPNEETLMKKRYVDAPAPPLSALQTAQGNSIASLAPLKGQVVVVEFWATWCIPCRITAPLLSDWSDRYGAEGLKVLGVTSESLVLAADAARQHKMSYTVLSDETGATTRAYRAFALPTLFVIDRRGVVRDVVVGFSGARLRQTEKLIQQLLAERV